MPSGSRPPARDAHRPRRGARRRSRCAMRCLLPMSGTSGAPFHAVVEDGFGAGFPCRLDRRIETLLVQGHRAGPAMPDALRISATSLTEISQDQP